MISTSGSSYEWYECGIDTLIVKTNLPYYKPTKSGEYYGVIHGTYCDTKTKCIPYVISSTAFTTIKKVKLIPNPVQDILYIETDQTFDSFEILTIEGQILLKGSFNTELHVGHLTSGTYVLKLSHLGQYESATWVKR
jgi:hypothetical protein